MAPPSPSTEVVLTVVQTPTRPTCAPSDGPRTSRRSARELDAMREQVIASRGRARRGVHPPGDRRPARLELGGRAVLLGEPQPPGVGARHGRPRRWPRSSTTWRSATTSSTASGTGCATRRSTPRPGSGTTSSPPEQWKRAHNEPHHKYTNIARQGQRPRLRHHARRRGAAVAAAATWPSRCGTSSTPASSSTASRCTTSTSASTLREQARHAAGDQGRAAADAAQGRAARSTKDYVVHPALSGPGVAPHPGRQPRPPTWSATCGATR